MNLEFYDVLRFITVFLFLFFSIFLFTLKKGNTLSNKLFAVFLFSKALCFSNGLFYRFKTVFISFTPHVFNVGLSFEFLLGPALLLYAKSLAYNDFRLKKIHVLHLIPFILHFIYMSFKFHIYSSTAKIDILSRYLFTLDEYILNTLAIYLHFLIYSIATLMVLFNYRSELKNLFSAIEKVKLSWLEVIVSGFILIWGLSFVVFLLNIQGYEIYYPESVSLILLFTFANVILYKGLKQPEIFAGIRQRKANNKLTFDEVTYNNYLCQLKEIMKNEKPYLMPDLTLDDLAGRISINPRYLSQLIRRSFNLNFFDFINTHRIEESKKLLSSDDDKKKTVLEILYDSGFNSKSAFNNAFKKYTGITPTEYRRHQATA